MLESISNLSMHTHISGCEKDLLKAIEREVSLVSDVESFYLSNCLICKKKGSATRSRKVLVSFPIDIPGFIALFLSDNKVYLEKIGEFDISLEKTTILQSESNQEFSLFKTSEEPISLYIEDSSAKLGDVYQIKSEIFQKEGKIFGRYVSKYSIIRIMLSLLQQIQNDNVYFCFATGGETKVTREAQVIKQLSPDFSLLLSRFEAKEPFPMIFLKDGKAFSDRGLVEELKNTARKIRRKTNESVSDQNVSKAESVFSETGIPLISVGIPCENKNKNNESVKLDSISRTLLLLKEFLD